MLGRRAKNLMIVPMTILLVLVLGFFGVQGFVVSSLALEQYARCGIDEHIHIEECYSDGRLL